MGKRVRPLYAFAIDADLAGGLKALKARDGVTESDTIRKALRAWLRRKGVLSKDASAGIQRIRKSPKR